MDLIFFSFSQDINNRKNVAFFDLRDWYSKGKAQYMALKEELAKWRGISLPWALALVFTLVGSQLAMMLCSRSGGAGGGGEDEG